MGHPLIAGELPLLSRSIVVLPYPVELETGLARILRSTMTVKLYLWMILPPPSSPHLTPRQTGVGNRRPPVAPPTGAQPKRL